MVQRIRGPQVAQRIAFDYRVDPRPRYGYGHPAHPLLAETIGRGRQRYAELLRSFLEFEQQLLTIRVHHVDDESTEPAWINGWLPGLDIVALYSLVALRRPARYFEVGSGQSTRIVRKAIVDQQLPTRVVSRLSRSS